MVRRPSRDDKLVAAPFLIVGGLLLAFSSLYSFAIGNATFGAIMLGMVAILALLSYVGLRR